ncbi:hypothetical protein JKP88DRAFT_296441 [Tribonema minus]|uniref:VCBS repeat-containing protein n=1 Tax=Tribonema minus TaxID=303371 RepID=A0A835ZDT6_9STRA|nr:hypothetical protein JKP88DRAFT_296441 [Tribonema minus]
MHSASEADAGFSELADASEDRRELLAQSEAVGVTHSQMESQEAVADGNRSTAHTASADLQDRPPEPRLGQAKFRGSLSSARSADDWHFGRRLVDSPSTVIATLLNTGSKYGLAVADLNNDGLSDALILDGNINAGNTWTSTTVASTALLSMLGATTYNAIATGNMNADAYIEKVVATGTAIYIFNYLDAHTTACSGFTNIARIAVADMDANGLADIAVADAGHGVKICYQTSANVFSVWTIDTTIQPTLIVAMDYYLTGRMDLIVAEGGVASGDVKTYANNGGQGFFSQRTVASAQAYVTAVVGGNVGLYATQQEVLTTRDALCASPRSRYYIYSVFLGIYSFAMYTHDAAITQAQDVAMADADHDTQDDIIILSSGESALYVYQATTVSGARAWNKYTASTSLTGAKLMALGDINNDGWLDVLTLSTGEGKVRWFYNTWAPTPQPTPVPTATPTAMPTAVPTAYTGTYSYTYCKPDLNSDSDSNCSANCNSHGNANGYANQHAYGRANSYTYCNPDLNADSDPNCGADCDSHGYAHQHAYSRSNG